MRVKAAVRSVERGAWSVERERPRVKREGRAAEFLIEGKFITSFPAQDIVFVRALIRSRHWVDHFVGPGGPDHDGAIKFEIR